jgi:hypothetical protein
VEETEVACKCKLFVLVHFFCLSVSASRVLSLVSENVAPILQLHVAFIPSAIVSWNIGDFDAWAALSNLHV